MKYEVVLWDFDGTLVDTSEGIFQSLRAAFTKMGMPVPEQSVLQKFIGPPIIYSFMNFMGMTEEDALCALNYFRADYEAAGIYCCKVYDGLIDLIKRLRKSGVKIGVATLKPEAMANLLLKHFQIDDLIDVCSGSISDHVGSASKSQIIDEALQRIGYKNKSQVVLIGDTVYDADGARESGLDFAAAAYGFGINKKDKHLLDCVCMADSAADLERFLFGD
ncbi:HAD-IA family hydrolase [Oscillospiraceae bacterium PP1C4]